MNTIDDNKSSNQTTKIPVVRMGREVGSKNKSSGDPDKDLQRAENIEKERIRENEASSLV
jgi:hypothetical protein